jgi:hypothetical protein
VQAAAGPAAAARQGEGAAAQGQLLPYMGLQCYFRHVFRSICTVSAEVSCVGLADVGVQVQLGERGLFSLILTCRSIPVSEICPTLYIAARAGETSLQCRLTCRCLASGAAAIWTALPMTTISISSLWARSRIT